jgi:hypothetical protein
MPLLPAIIASGTNTVESNRKPHGCTGPLDPNLQTQHRRRLVVLRRANGRTSYAVPRKAACFDHHHCAIGATYSRRRADRIHQRTGFAMSIGLPGRRSSGAGDDPFCPVA